MEGGGGLKSPGPVWAGKVINGFLGAKHTSALFEFREKTIVIVITDDSLRKLGEKEIRSTLV